MRTSLHYSIGFNVDHNHLNEHRVVYALYEEEIIAAIRHEVEVSILKTEHRKNITYHNAYYILIHI